MSSCHHHHHHKCNKTSKCGEYVFNPKEREQTLFSKYETNTLTPAEVQGVLSLISDPATKYQFTYYLESNLNKPQKFPVSIESMQCLAKSKLGKYLWVYIEDNAGSGQTYKFNLSELESYKLIPNIGTGAASLPFTFSQTVNFGSYSISVPTPFFVCPMGNQTVADPKGDITTALGAADQTTSFVYSSQSSFSIEELKAECPTTDLYFQLYASGIPQLNTSFINRAVAAGCKAIFLTLDVPKYAIRERELELGFAPSTWKAKLLPGGYSTSPTTGSLNGLGMYATDPVFNTVQSQQFGSVSNAAFINLPGGPFPVNINQGLILYSGISATSGKITLAGPVANPFSLAWFVNEVQTKHNIPLIVKGVSKVKDAEAIVESGASGVYVSNHGGRSFDGAVAAIDQLKEVVDAVKAKALELDIPKPAVLFDSGIRRGSDIVKAYALGAEWVGVGRPVLYGLGAGGREGVAHVLQTLKADLENTTQNIGYTSVNQVQIDDVKKF